MRLAPHDRRRWDRVDLVKPCKVFLPGSGTFAPGRTCNLSRAGLLLTLESARPLRPGDPIEVSIFHNRSPVISAQELTRARVRRAEVFDTDRQLVAVEFELPAEQLAAA
jgi:hypothetical protein